MHAQPQAQADFFRSSPLMTRNDFTDAETVKDAAHALRRAGADQAALAAWAIRWGDLLIARCDETSHLAGDESEDLKLLEAELDEARDELKDAEEERDQVQAAARAAIRALDKIAGNLGDDLREEIDRAISGLENVL